MVEIDVPSTGRGLLAGVSILLIVVLVVYANGLAVAIGAAIVLVAAYVVWLVGYRIDRRLRGGV